MDPHYLSEIKQQLQEVGSVMMPIADSFLSDDDFDTLKQLSDQLPQEFVETGDAGEPNHVLVGRFMTDIERPEKVNQPMSDRALEIVTQPAAMTACRELLDAENLYVRRMQVNSMQTGSFVGEHLDKDSNPDYRVAVILQFGEDFTGGKYVVSGGDRPARVFKPYFRSLMISDCNFPHEVTKVESGERVSLVYFLSEHDGGNRRIKEET
jgi:hypothetical protein